MVYREFNDLQPSCCARMQHELTEWFCHTDKNMFSLEQKELAKLLHHVPNENVLQMGLETLNYVSELNAACRAVA